MICKVSVIVVLNSARYLSNNNFPTFIYFALLATTSLSRNYQLCAVLQKLYHPCTQMSLSLGQLGLQVHTWSALRLMRLFNVHAVCCKNPSQLDKWKMKKGGEARKEIAKQNLEIFKEKQTGEVRKTRRGQSTFHRGDVQIQRDQAEW